MEKLVVKNLYKIFGPNPQRAIDMLEQGASKDEILKRTGLTVGIDRADFSVQEGEIFVIMGLSGSGKSTLVRCMNRLIEATQGEILLNGERDIAKMDPHQLRQIRRTNMSMVFQNFALMPNRTVLGNIEYGLEIQGIEKETRQEKAMEALELVGLDGYEHSRPAQLSGGMKQRVGLARALANDPEILLMDEAFSALDPLIRSDMQDELLDLHQAMKKTIVFITHDLDEALKLGDRILLMNDGRTAQIGTAEEILTSPNDEYVRRFVQGVNRSDILTAGDIMAKPWTTVGISQGPRLALREMGEHGTEAILVIGEERKLAGVVTIEAAQEAIEAGKKTLHDIVVRDMPHRVQPDASISDLIEHTATSSIPVAVVDDGGRLKGVIVKGNVLQALIPDKGGENHAENTGR